MFTALMLSVTLILTFVSIWFAQASRTANSRYFAPLVLILTTGVNGALLTADLFNLFVFLEVMLLPTYGLYVLSANRKLPLRRVHRSEEHTSELQSRGHLVYCLLIN